MNTLWYILTMEYDSAIKRSELVIHITTWMTLRGIMLSESSQIRKITYHIIAFR